MKPKRAKVIIKNFDEKSMYCPSCLTKLEGTGGFNYESVCGDLIYSIKWVCPSKGFLNSKTGKFQQCLCHKYQTVWNDDGDFFSGEEYLQIKKIQFIQGDKTYAAFNSFAKQCEVEIYKTGLPKEKYLHPALCLWFLRPVIRYTYKSDKMGNILKSGWKMEYLKKQRGRRGYHVVYMSPIRMFKFCVRQFNKNLKGYKKNPNEQWIIERLHQDFEKHMWDKRSWRIAFWIYQSVFYFRLRKEIEKKFKKISENV